MKMKADRLTTIFLLLMLIQINKRSGISCCGRLKPSIVPSLLYSYETHHWPWHAAIYHQYNESYSIYQCGGTLISSSSIITAAHCVQINAEYLSVSLGRLYLNASESSAPMIGVAKISQHENYNRYNLENDIAIITLSTNATYNNFIQPICLWKEDRMDLSEIVGKSGTVVGWGLTENGTVSNVLQQASLPVVDHLTCLYSNRDLFGSSLARTNYCAGSRNGTNVCQGDSGGSMIFEQNGRYYIRGIVSKIATKIILETQEYVCDTMQYAIFTDVAQFIPWIKDTAQIIDKEMVECQMNVRCNLDFDDICSIFINVTHSSPKCKINFDFISNDDVTELDVSGEFDSIPNLSNAVAKIGNLERLHLANVKLKFVEGDSLSAFRKIRTLRLHSNEISQIDGGTFDDLNNLVELDLSHNELKEVHPDLFKELKKVQNLLLNKNSLESIPSSVFQNNKKMRTLDISHNRLIGIHSDLFSELDQLGTLDLSDNNLESLPPSLFQFSINIETLTISRNKLEEVHPDLFKGLENINMLDLSSNNIKTLAPFIFRNNKNIMRLDISRNHLKEVHPNLFRELVNLEWLDLSNNNLETLPSTLFRNNDNIRALSLGRNQFNEIHPKILKGLEYLRTFSLAENNLETLSSSLFQTNTRLEQIFLNGNKIKKIESNFANMPLLSLLDLSGNICIDKKCNVSTFCGSSSLIEMGENIQTNCTSTD